MPESTEFSENHEELDSEYHRRLQEHLAKKQHKHQWHAARHQHQQELSDDGGEGDAAAVKAGKESSSGESELTPRDSSTCGSAAAAGAGAGGEELWADEAGGDAVEAAVSKRHYVPLWELFRGYWSGLVLHVAYAACELCGCSQSKGSAVLIQHSLSTGLMCRLPFFVLNPVIL